MGLCRLHDDHGESRIAPPPTGSLTRVRINVKSGWRGQAGRSRKDKGREMGKYDSKDVARKRER